LQVPQSGICKGVSRRIGLKIRLSSSVSFAFWAGRYVELARWVVESVLVLTRRLRVSSIGKVVAVDVELSATATATATATARN
jgi:hypothetical protein